MQGAWQTAVQPPPGQAAFEAPLAPHAASSPGGDGPSVSWASEDSGCSDSLDGSESSLGSSDASEAPRSIVPIVAVQFLYMVGLAMTVPVFPFIWTSTPMASGDDVRGATLHANGIFINAAAEFFSASFLGVLSDRFGRRPFLALASLGQVIDFAVAALATPRLRDMFEDTWGHLSEQPALYMVIARTLAGLLGNLTIFAKASVADLNIAESSTRNFAFLAASIGLGFIIGTPVGGILAKRFGLHVPMTIASCLNGLSIIIIWHIPEPLLAKNRRPVVWLKANPFGVLSFLRSSRFLKFFAAMALLDQFSLSLVTTLMVPYSVTVFGVDKSVVTTLVLAFGVTQLGLFALFLRRIVMTFGEIAVMQAGYIVSWASYVALAVISYMGVFPLMYVACILLGVGTISGPTQTAIASRCVEKSEQGVLQAANGSLDVVGKMLASGLVSLTFKPLVHAGQPGVIWWIASLVLLPGVAIALRVLQLLPPGFREVRGGGAADRADQGGSSSDALSPRPR